MMSRNQQSDLEAENQNIIIGPHFYMEKFSVLLANVLKTAPLLQ